MAVNATDDSAVIREVLSGRTEAFRALVERYFATVRLVALAKTGNLADAEDVAQETFIKAYETLGVLRNRERLAPWLVAIARNIAISLVRRRERERRNAEACPIDSMVHPDHERRETLDAVARQVEALPENLREVVLLHYFEGLKCREIGERLDLNTNAVVKRLSRGRELLGDRLLREWGEGARPETAKPGVSRVMGAIAVLPRPDWKAQLARMGGAGTALNVGGLAAALLGPPLAFKVFTAVSAVALGVLYVSLNVRGGGDQSPTASAGTSAPVEEKGVIVAAASGMGELIKNAFASDEDGPVWVAIEPPPPRREIGFIAGTVVDQDGAPVRDAGVSAVGAHLPSPGETSGHSTTNPSGAFRINVSSPITLIEAREAHKYLDVICSAPGYVPRTAPGVRLGSTDVHMVLMRPAVVSGTVLDAATRAPVTEFSLRIDGPGPIRNPDTGMAINSAWRETRSASGKFQIEGQYGVGKLDVIAPGYVGSSIATGLSQGEAEPGLVVALSRGGEVRGFVYDLETRQPVQHATVVYLPEIEEPREQYGVQTGEDGAFTLPDLPTSVDFVLHVDASGFAREILSVPVTAASEPIAIYLGRGATLRGHVAYNGGPPPGSDKVRREDGYCYVRVAVAGDLGWNGGLGYVNPDGSYEVTGLEDGKYLVCAYFWTDGGRFQESSSYKQLDVRDGRANTLDINFDEIGGKIHVNISGAADPYEAQIDLLSLLDPVTVLERHEPNPWFMSRQVDRSVTFPQAGTTLEPGEYLVKAYMPEEEGSALEESVQVVAGQTVEVNFNFGGNEDDTDGQVLDDGTGTEVTEELVDTIESP